MALCIPHSIFHLAWLLYVRSETFGPYYVRRRSCTQQRQVKDFEVWDIDILRAVIKEVLPHFQNSKSSVNTADEVTFVG